jgi:hypothetical protein
VTAIIENWIWPRDKAILNYWEGGHVGSEIHPLDDRSPDYRHCADAGPAILSRSIVAVHLALIPAAAIAYRASCST